MLRREMLLDMLCTWQGRDEGDNLNHVRSIFNGSGSPGMFFSSVARQGLERVKIQFLYSSILY
jgi:hypothetical protein